MDNDVARVYGTQERCEWAQSCTYFGALQHTNANTASEGRCWWVTTSRAHRRPQSPTSRAFSRADFLSLVEVDPILIFTSLARYDDLYSELLEKKATLGSHINYEHLADEGPENRESEIGKVQR